MALTGWSTSNYLSRGAVYDTYPFLVSIWTYTTVNNVEYFPLSMGTSGSQDNQRCSIRTASSPTDYQIRARVTTNNDMCNTAILTSQWVHLAAYEKATNARDFAKNGTFVGQNATSVAPNAGNIVTIGVRADIGAPWQATGGLAEYSIWDTSGMSDANVTTLTGKLFNGGAGGAGGNPLLITAESAQPWTGKLKAYWIDSANTINDLSGNGFNMTQTGTLTNFATGHPNIEVASVNTNISPFTMVKGT